MAEETRDVERCKIIELPEIEAGVAQGGLGKVQFAIKTQYLIDKIAGLNTVLCAGACGGLAKEVQLADVVVATETIEHDILHHSDTEMPKFPSDQTIVAEFKNLPGLLKRFPVHFGPIASGDEDIMSDERKSELLEQTNAIAVAWEGAGGARACRFNKLPYAEVRGVSDSADSQAHKDYYSNLEKVMANLAELIVEWGLATTKNQSPSS